MTWILINMRRFVWQNSWLQLLGRPTTPKPPFTTLQLLRERLSVQNGHFKAYFLALLAKKDYSTVLESLAKVEKSLSHRNNAATRLRRSLPYARPVSNQRPNNIRCFYCGMAGHRVAQCYRKQRDMASSKSPQSDVSKSFANKLR